MTPGEDGRLCNLMRQKDPMKKSWEAIVSDVLGRRLVKGGNVLLEFGDYSVDMEVSVNHSITFANNNKVPFTISRDAEKEGH